MPFLLALTLARLQYDGGGDWYNDPEVLPNLARFANSEAGLRLEEREVVVSLKDREIFNYPFVYMTGHGTVRFSDAEARLLREYLEAGGFLYVDDDYGLDESFRHEIKKVFPDKELVEVPFDHPIYHLFYDFPDGPPKIHEHYPGPPRGYGIFIGGRLALFYTYNSNVSDGWTTRHGDPEPVRLKALRMGLNILLYSLLY